MPSAWRILLWCETVSAKHGIPFSLADLMFAYEIYQAGSTRFSLKIQPGMEPLILNTPASDRQWSSRFFFADLDSLGPDCNFLSTCWTRETPGPKVIPTREESAAIVECFLAIPAEERTIVNRNLTMATISASVEDVLSDSEEEDNNSRSNSPIIPARSLAVISQSVAVGRESSRSSFAKHWASKTKTVTPLIMPSLGETSKKKKTTSPVKEQPNLKRKRADSLGHDFASTVDNTMGVVWPELKHLLNERVAEGYSQWDMPDIFNEAGSNAYKAFQGLLAGLSVLESMKDFEKIAKEREVKVIADLQAKVDQVSSELAKVTAEKVALEVSKEALEESERALKEQVAMKGKRLLQLAEGAGDIATYYSQERAIEMMEECQAGHHTAWDAEESRRQLAIDFPGGAPGTDLLDLYFKIVASVVVDP